MPSPVSAPNDAGFNGGAQSVAKHRGKMGGAGGFSALLQALFGGKPSKMVLAGEKMPSLVEQEPSMVDIVDDGKALGLKKGRNVPQGTVAATGNGGVEKDDTLPLKKGRCKVPGDEELSMASLALPLLNAFTDSRFSASQVGSGRSLVQSEMLLNRPSMVPPLPVDEGQEAPLLSGQKKLQVPTALSSHSFVHLLKGLVQAKAESVEPSEGAFVQFKAQGKRVLSKEVGVKREEIAPFKAAPLQRQTAVPEQGAMQKSKSEGHSKIFGETLRKPVFTLKPLGAAGEVPAAPAMDDTLSLPGSIKSMESNETPRTGLTKRLALQVGRQIATSLKQNDKEVVFQVRPPSLGRIQMRIEKEGETLSVRIVSEKEKAGELLASGKGEIRTLLLEHGIRVDRIEVEQGSSMQFAQQGGGDARDGRQRFNGHDGDQAAQHGGRDAPEAPPDGRRHHDGSISITA